MQFVKYQHVEKYGTAETEGIQHGMCYIFPKIDGTNGSIWVDFPDIKAGSRNRELTLENDNTQHFDCSVADAPTLNIPSSNPYWFGAIGDGDIANNDTDAIKKAIASSTESLGLPDGSFPIDPITIDKGIKGVGQTKSILKMRTNTDTMITIEDDTDFHQFKDFNMVGIDSSNGVCLQIGDSVNNCTFENIKIGSVKWGFPIYK